jgi:hypothetical protein
MVDCQQTNKQGNRIGIGSCATVLINRFVVLNQSYLVQFQSYKKAARLECFSYHVCFDVLVSSCFSFELF